MDGFPAALLARIASSWDRIGLWPDGLPGGTFSPWGRVVLVFERAIPGLLLLFGTGLSPSVSSSCMVDVSITFLCSHI